MTDNSGGMLNSALIYADRGWNVFPTHYIDRGRCSCGKPCSSPGKHPVTNDGLHSATTDHSQIRRWWTQNPNYNIAVATGKQSNLWVIDVDSRKSVVLGDGVLGSEGEYSLTVAEDRYGVRIPDTLIQNTGGGGKHYLYSYPDDGKYGNRTHILPSIDIRGEGGYILVAPSNHESGSKYEWQDEGHPVVKAPLSLLDITLGKEPGSTSDFNQSWSQESGVGEGRRNDYLYRFACSQRGMGEEYSTILLRTMNRNTADCEPPVDHAEVRTIVESAMRWEPNPPQATFDIEDDGYDDDELVVAEIPTLRDGDVSLVSLSHLLTYPPDPPRPLVYAGLLDIGEGAILAGPPHVGKSWLALDLALAVAGGNKWMDYFPTTQGSVLIVDEEGSMGAMSRRMRKLLESRGDDGFELPVFMSIQRGIRLDTPRGAVILQRMVEKVKPSLVIMDSMIRFHGGNENSSQEMSQFFTIPNKIKNAYDTSILFLHHVRKVSKNEEDVDLGSLMRGSGDILGWPDSVFVVIPSTGDFADGITFKHEKSREHQKLPKFNVGVAVSDQSALVTVKDEDRQMLDHYVNLEQKDMEGLDIDH